MGLTSDQVLTTTARLTWIINAFEAACGVGNVTADTTGIAGANEETHILGTADTEAINAMLPASTRLKERLTAQNYFGAVAEYLQGLDAALGGLNTWLSDNGKYISAQLRKAYSVLQARYCFPPVTDFGSIVLSGSGTGAFTEENTVDTDDYGDALIEIVTESVIGAAEITGTIHGSDYNGNAVQADYTITAATGNDATVAIAGTTRFVSVDKTLTDAAISGGTAADAYRIQTKVDRAAAI